MGQDKRLKFLFFTVKILLNHETHALVAATRASAERHEKNVLRSFAPSLAEHFARGSELEQIIRENLKGIGYDF